MKQPMNSAAVQCVLRAESIVGESPVWSARDQSLYWVDITGRKIHRFHFESRVNDTFHLPQPVTSLALRHSGGLVLTLPKDFALFDPHTGSLEAIGRVEESMPKNRFNDGKCDRQGRFWAGTMDAADWDAPAGSLYRLAPDRKFTRERTGCICCNGLDWSPDNRLMYFTESFRYVIYVYDFDPVIGEMANPRVFASVDRSSGAFPDGLTVDQEGGVWSVHNAVGRVVRYTPEGQVDRIVELPVPRPCSCAFGGPDLDVLFVTTARETMNEEQIAQAPLSGSLFAVFPEVRGLPAATFAG
jgi:sugar lactone lactonase YvrE